MFFFVSICYANHDIAYNEATIGGIGIDYSEDYLLQVYGQPTSIEKETGYTKTYNYNGNFKVTITKSSGLVQYVVCTDPDLKTPSGFGVGTKMTDVVRVYGVPGRVKNTIPYLYYAELPHPSRQHSLAVLSFYLDGQRKVKKLSLISI